MMSPRGWTGTIKKRQAQAYRRVLLVGLADQKCQGEKGVIFLDS